MDTLIDVLIVSSDLVVLPLMIGTVTLCFLKGRRTAGWVGVAVLGISVVSVFPLFRVLREHDAEGWLLVPYLVGFAILVLLGREALQPAIDTSWWARRHPGQQANRNAR